MKADAFWRRVNKQGPEPSHVPGLGPCWLWTGTKDRKGYGRLYVRHEHGRRTTGAHRHGYQLVNGPIDPGTLVLHRCDNPLCVNPDHLFLGTQADNMADAKEKGRLATASELPQTVLTEEQVVRAIREISEGASTMRELAQEFGVTDATLNSAVRGTKSWQHLERDHEALARALGGNRNPSGERHPQAKLTSEQVRAIRASYTGAAGEQAALARQYGVSFCVISNLLRYKTYKDA